MTIKLVGQLESVLYLKSTMGFSQGKETTVPNNSVPILRGWYKVGFGFTQIGLCHEIVPFVYLCIKFHTQ